LVSTGLNGLDEIMNGLRMGDNVVWQWMTSKITVILLPFCPQGLGENKKVVYMRFAQHAPPGKPGG